MKGIYNLLDSRIAQFINELDSDPNFIIPDWSKYILVSGKAKEMCDYATNGSYGDLCVVANSEGRIMFEWFNGESWNIN